MKRKNFHLSELQIKRLEKLSADSGLSVAEIIRRAIDEHFNRLQHESIQPKFWSNVEVKVK